MPGKHVAEEKKNWLPLLLAEEDWRECMNSEYVKETEADRSSTKQGIDTQERQCTKAMFRSKKIVVSC